MTDPQQLHRVASSLRRAIAPGQEDFEHPDYQELVAFAEARLGDVEREIVETHIALCMQCADDVRDIFEIRAQMGVSPRATTNTWKYLVGAAVVAAAALLVAVKVLGPSSPVPGSQPSSVQGAVSPGGAPAPSETPRETALSVAEQTVVDAAIASGRVDVPLSVRALEGSVGQLLGPETGASALLPMAPSGTVVTSASPQFSWRPIAGAVSYRVAVFDASFRELASSGALTSATWTPSMVLPRNVPLAWQITARMPDGSDVLAPAPPRPEARFTVIDEAGAAAIADLRSRLASQPIALGILLAKAGLLDDASREFERAMTEPTLAEIASKLRASLRPTP